MSTRHRSNARPSSRSHGRRGSTIGLIAASALAIAASAWMTMSASPAMTGPRPVAQQEAQRAPAPAPTVEPAAPATPAAHAAPVANASTPAESASAPAPAPAGGAAQQARIDPKTGQLRPIEHDDAQIATAGPRRLSRTAASEPVEFFTDSGIPGATVPDELQAYTVATRTPDGKIVLEHVQGGKAAAERVRKNASKTGLSHRKGEPNDR